MSKKLLLMSLCIFQINSGFATDTKTEARAIMDGVYDSFVKVIPYVYSDEKRMEALGTNASQKENLLKNLTDLSEFLKVLVT